MLHHGNSIVSKTENKPINEGGWWIFIRKVLKVQMSSGSCR